MAREITLTARYEPPQDGWVQATIDEIPGVITTGATQDEAREMLADALRTWLLSLGDPRRIETRREGKTEPLRLTIDA